MHNRLGNYSRYRHKVGCSGGTGDLRCLHDRAGTFASLLYKDEKCKMVSVCPSVCPSCSLLSHLSMLSSEICFCDC